MNLASHFKQTGYLSPVLLITVFFLFFSCFPASAEDIPFDSGVTDPDIALSDTAIAAPQGSREQLDLLAAENLNTLKDGTAIVFSTLTENSALDVHEESPDNGSAIELNEAHICNSQNWEIRHDSAGYIIFYNQKSNKVLDVANGNAFEGSRIQLYEFNDTWAQKWIAIEENDAIKIISALDSSLVLDLKNGQTTSGTPLQL